ncbi:anthranilate phosphoribosyltransferase [Verticillium alfalfae VaMs.102]|uniref:Anthranilate phosphoribosyltransferase n=1 Tax=Verticillium alfalfae (strain VaMs.102 / ATCC MYA-4576 / FGSC 10136) TaxID=526221 RepID=C9S867_VERA1|nr:anthranilate phosphoribosyltransferase [Verticillium alfalfae VaMs.102]EEY15317.1 anthranilate phosphoribosyltransferase [Verticillium alfalfae VaMs.102]
MSLPKSGDHPPAALPPIDIKPLLKRLWPVPLNGPQVTADEIAEAISHFFTARVSQAQAASLLISLHFTNLDRRADVMAKSAYVMRQAAAAVDLPSLDRVVKAKGLAEGGYGGGLCDIVGTGGDAYNTFNISTTASILASALLAVSKHGNKASTSKSGSADLVAHMQPRAPVITNVSPATLEKVYAATNYAFLFAPVFHPGMRFVAPIRKELPWRTIFNLLGPLANPVEDALEARVIGVARKELGPVFAEALTIAGSRKAMIICGDEELDEVSCAGPTLIWRLREGARRRRQDRPLHRRARRLWSADAPARRGVTRQGAGGKTPRSCAASSAARSPTTTPLWSLSSSTRPPSLSSRASARPTRAAWGPATTETSSRSGARRRALEGGVRRAPWAVKSGARLEAVVGFCGRTNGLRDARLRGGVAAEVRKVTAKAEQKLR